MKTVKLTEDGGHLNLWRFFEKRLPSTLVARRKDDGYGGIYAIDVRDSTESRLSRIFKHGIATVTGDYVELRHPEWFSDFSDICKAYESETGEEVTLAFWEAV